MTRTRRTTSCGSRQTIYGQRSGRWRPASRGPAAGGQLQGQHAGAGRDQILPEAGRAMRRPSERAQVRTLLVCIGPTPRQQMDLAALRAVRAATGLRFSRLVDTTQRKFAACLRRERGLGHPVELLHLALPVAAEGIQFTDGWADGNWLSELLQGVQVLLLVGCAGENAGRPIGRLAGGRAARRQRGRGDRRRGCGRADAAFLAGDLRRQGARGGAGGGVGRTARRR